MDVNNPISPEPQVGRREFITRGLLMAAGLAALAACDDSSAYSRQPRRQSPEIQTSPTSVIAEIPTTTTTQEAPLILREMQPGQKIGTMSVEISGGGARQSLITHDLITDGRSAEEVEAEIPVDINGSNEVLEHGFMVHRDSYIPGWNASAVSATDRKQKLATIVAGHRASAITGSPYGSLVLRDVDKIQVGDKLTLALDDGTVATYQAVGNEKVSEYDTATLERLFHRTSEKEILSIYACDTSNPAGIPTQGQYNPDLRYFVHYERIS